MKIGKRPSVQAKTPKAETAKAPAAAKKKSADGFDAKSKPAAKSMHDMQMTPVRNLRG